MDHGILITLILYFIVMFGMGIAHFRRKENLEGYLLGGRRVGPWVSAMSAEASDMSGWMLMGLPGYAYMCGISAYWIALGLAIGTFLNWALVAQRLRVFTVVANNSLTIPDFFENRYGDKSKILRVVCAIFIFIFFLIYTASSFVAGGRLFNTVFGVDYVSSLIITAGIVVFYSFFGGYTAVCRTDFFQGCLMFFTIILVPVTAMMSLGGPVNTVETLNSIHQGFFSFFTDATGSTLSTVAIISLLAWGLGYFGQPHIIIRFMGIRSAKDIPQAIKIAMVWVVFSLFFAVASGMVGRAVLGGTLQGVQSETVFMVLSGKFFSSLPAGIIIAAILGAIMSTSSSQLLVSASAVTTDFYHALIRKNATPGELVTVSRIAVFFCALCSMYLAMNPNNYILDLVAYAWAGFGAAFGPLVLFSLYWRRTNLNGAIAGVVVGGVTVLLWKNFMAWTGLYEILPGFVFSCIAIYVVSLMTAPPAENLVKQFDESLHILKSGEDVNPSRNDF